ncbi:hypothetical protein D3C83_69160 [compost metagenome]
MPDVYVPASDRLFSNGAKREVVIGDARATANVTEVADAFGVRNPSTMSPSTSVRDTNKGSLDEDA